MINKILSYFPDSVTQEYIPVPPSPDYYWFREADERPLWIGIPKKKFLKASLN